MKVVSRLRAALTLSAAGAGLLLLPGALRLGRLTPTSLEDVVSIDDAVAACLRTGLEGWELVTYAQRLVSRKFTHYSVLNLWDSPARAFEHGMGYCTQYNLALKQILDRLCFDTQAVFCMQVRVVGFPEWRLGHTWLRVTIAGETHDVCARDIANTPGHVGFVPVKRVWKGNEAVLFLTNLGMILFCGGIGWKALITRQPAPAWTFYDRSTLNQPAPAAGDLISAGT